MTWTVTNLVIQMVTSVLGADLARYAINRPLLDLFSVFFKECTLEDVLGSTRSDRP
jgi:hypothetical protein